MTKLDTLTEDQARRLLAVVDSGKGRNWGWLLSWLNDKDTHSSYGDLSSPDYTVKFYEIDHGWEDWTPEGVHSG